MISPPEFTVIGDVHTFRWPTVEVQLDRFSERKDDLTAEMTVYSTDPVSHGLLHDARFNLSVSTTRKQVAEMLNSRMDYDWYAVLETVCKLAKERWREGEPSVNLWDVKPQETRWLLYPYVEFGSPTVLFAYGGSGKSVMALAMAYTVASGAKRFVGSTDGVVRPVLYLDWETQAEVHTERLRAIAKGQEQTQPPIYYKRMTTSLPEAAGSIRKEIAKTGAQLVVVDSLGYAGGNAPEEAATAIALFGAIRTFGVATLCLHHRRKGNGVKGGDPESLFGSAYYFNSARHVWQLQGAKDENDESLAVGLIHSKSNNGRLNKRHAFTIKFTNNTAGMTEAIAFRYQDSLANVPALADQASLNDRILAELKHGAHTVDELTEILEAKKDSVKVKVSGLRAQGKIVRVEGNRWGMPAVNE